jgi:hypothetical protein
MGLLDKAKAVAEQAANRAKEGVEDVQTKRELSQAYNELGKTTFELIEGGEISNPRLDAIAAKVRTLKEKAESDGNGATASTASTASEPYDSSQPPAMPS